MQRPSELVTVDSMQRGDEIRGVVKLARTVMPHPQRSLDLVASDFRLFGAMKEK
jgi:hypothetical protein